MAFFLWVLALAITSLIALVYIYRKKGRSRRRRQVRKKRRVRVDRRRLPKRPAKKTEHQMPGPVYVEQPWLTECLSQGDCYFKCGKWRKEKPAHHRRRPLSVQDLWLTIGQGGFLPEHERWLQEFLCGTMRPMLPPLQTPALSTTKAERTRPYFVETDPNHPNLSCGLNRRAVHLQQVGRAKVLRRFRKLAEPPLETPALSTSRTDPTRPYFVAPQNQQVCLTCGLDPTTTFLKKKGRFETLKRFRKMNEKTSRKRKRPYDPGEGPRIKRRRIWP
ncbi:uncharacterized protein LOC128340513 [Hemicordylus capensis]|uniref:uncharacterized protein LOC128340512 n=1 Tax=Hemicordylus capensis TaxID=884348 RepID=UPI002302BF9B|nr:uncharacterized protein LOC128340512 [Hemicordylus capensis]XP_053141654.1 uncharacterized protein LOC128340512 [Hemicordylus capensis]XP_053141656.1 uncharacterized protein LOC128340512 [Hemicordylus capensis]XP_053141657.1 uncharacterized protein LOC128340512 [Hemicordylus capensis]XP_053141658.1 uncharacterized protein LOC128340512 [Hemicordylus capensis]XP_053141659.1 uncharacterized protein LOC128340512 [Hemicordylus capensis]XP_053141660.1 uncharacterized protein LOC128340512 [Hemico